MHQAKEILDSIEPPNSTTKNYTYEDRLHLLGISHIQEHKLTNEVFEQVDLNPQANQTGFFKDIQLDDLEGINRDIEQNINSWPKLLGALHKQINFDRFKGAQAFEQFLSETGEDSPCVIENDGKYYIHSNGKHRLTIAKCIGIKSLKVIVVLSE